MSIRLRLIIWHSAVFFAGLVAFAFIVWFGTRAALRNDLDTWLARHAEGLEHFLLMETHGISQAAVIEEAREYSSGLPVGSGIRLLDPRGSLLYSSSQAQPASVATVRGSVTIAGQEFDFIMWRSTEETQEALTDLRFVLTMLIPVFLLASVGGGWFLSRRALRPVDEITEAARQISLQNLSSSLPVPAYKDELQRLCTAWNEMLRRLDDSAGRLRQFTADASHELRTPVALIRTTAELALRKERSAEEYRSALERIGGKSSELSQLIENLMELARADSGQSGFSFAPLDVGELVREVQAQIEPASAQRNLHLAVDAPDGKLSLIGDRLALRRVLLILMDNAIKFTSAAGRVELRAKSGGDEIVFEVEDTGIGIADKDLSRIFDRFYQGDGARSDGGVGLGLSIAQWIVQGHNGRIEVISHLHRGSLFRVWLPKTTSAL